MVHITNNVLRNYYRTTYFRQTPYSSRRSYDTECQVVYFGWIFRPPLRIKSLSTYDIVQQESRFLSEIVDRLVFHKTINPLPIYFSMIHSTSPDRLMFLSYILMFLSYILYLIVILTYFRRGPCSNQILYCAYLS